MLSVLIPIYNCSITQLVKGIHDQCRNLKISFEIICFDDASLEKFKIKNRTISSMFNVSYIELSTNVGRSKIRNMLAQNARFEHLLFLDCDSKLLSEKFIKNYLNKTLSTDIICGGRKYRNSKPKDKDKFLHWKYGKNRESISEKKRNKHPFRYFHSNNFMILRSVLLSEPFEESIRNYGYEDLEFAYRMKNRDINILHINNPVLHLGLESKMEFLSKAKKASKNLALLYYNDRIDNTPLINTFQFIEKVRLLPACMLGMSKFNHYILKNLNSNRPLLFVFDLYKLQEFTLEYIKK